MMMKVPLMAAAKSVGSLKRLEEHAPITLEEFLAGYRDAMTGIPACDGTEPV